MVFIDPMNFKLYREHGALNSVPVFNAFEQGLRSLGHETVGSNEDVAVIWSVLWSGRMSANYEIYNKCRNTNKPIIIIEVGNLFRNRTWRVSLGHVNNLGFFGHHENLDPNRPAKLSISLKPLQLQRRPEILIAAQHQQSLQWQGQPPMSEWATTLVREIRKYSNRKIILRPHPRSKFNLIHSEIKIELPKPVLGSYDDFNIDYNYHCVINHSSGPAVQAAINGVPVICDSSSLAGILSEKMENIENPLLPDRDEWFLKLCHTEWTVEEIAQAVPLQRLLPEIIKKIS
jgi:hypothetical protein